MLRFAVASDGPLLEKWQVLAVDHLIQTGLAEPCLRIIGPSQPFASTETRPSIFELALSALWRPSAGRGARCNALDGLDSALRSEAGMALRRIEVDVIIDFTRDGSAYLAATTSCNVWCFRLGEGGYESLPVLWEIGAEKHCVRATLLCETPAGATTLLREGHLRLVNYSYSRAADLVFSEIAKWPAYACVEAAKGLVFEPCRGSEAEISYARLTGLAAMRCLRNLSLNSLYRFLERLFPEEWNIAVTRLSASDFIARKALGNVSWLPKPRTGWTADPMGIAVDEKLYVLCEEMDAQAERGQISCTTFDGSWGRLTRAIKTKTHASYPYLFQYDGNTYCLPETSEANEVALYRATKLPTDWERVATIMTGVGAIDPTVFVFGDRFWLMCTDQEESNSRLLAFFAESLFGPWQPHLRNPIKIDVRSARPAGPPFLVDGTLYRPAQDSSQTYGGRVVVNEIVDLTPSKFHEEGRMYVEPISETRYCAGLHTLSFTRDYCLIDGKRLPGIRRLFRGKR